MPAGADNASSSQIKNHAAFIWKVADQLRGDYKASEYGRVILPFTVLRRLDCVLDPVKAQMLAKYDAVRDRVSNVGPLLSMDTGIDGLWNTSPFDLPTLLEDPINLADNLRAYIHGFSPAATEILEKFDFPTHIKRLDNADLLFLVVSSFAEIDLHPDKVSNMEMGYLYEELIRKFSEASNETAGEHFTPREVIRLMVELLFAEDDDLLSKPGIVKTLFDPACGTGGMLSVAQDRLREFNPKARLEVFGQELNDETYAICRSDMMLKGQDASNIASGNSFSDDGHEGKRFDYLLANPPFGVEWKKVKKAVEAEHKNDGFAGRFGAGTPRINDGSFLFLQHMISKMKKPEDGGSRLAIVFNGSPLFTGAAGSGESEIRRWILENDWLDAIVALPDQLFYNTGISTYLLIVTNRKSPERRGSVRLIDASESFAPASTRVGEKRKLLGGEHVMEILNLYGLGRNDSIARDARTKSIANDDLRNEGTWAFEPWMFVGAIRPDQSIRLDEVVELVAQSKVTELPVVRMASLDGCATAGSLNEAAEIGRRYSVCKDGDIIGSGNKWAVIPQGFGTAATHLTVLRPKERFADTGELIRLWLESKDAAQQIDRGSGRVSTRMLAPVGLRDDPELARSALTFASARSEAMDIVQRLFLSEVDPFDQSGHHLHQLAANASGIRNLLLPLRNVVRRSEYEYPYQVASLARTYRLAITPTQNLDAGLALAEAIIRTLGVVAAAVQNKHSVEGRETLMPHFQGGISAGAWFEIIRPATQGELADIVPDLQLIGFKKREVGALLEACVKIRNEVKHHGGVLDDLAKTEIHARLEPHLLEALEGVGFMSGWEFVRVRRCEYLGPDFNVEFDRLNGSHPDWERAECTSSGPIRPNRLYLRASFLEEPLDLNPFASVHSCPECHRDEYYVLDKLLSPDQLQCSSLKNHKVKTKLD